MGRRRILITGGAGFVGSHLADRLLERGHHVVALDNLSPQVHGPERRRPRYLDPAVELLVGDVRDRDAVTRALKGVDAVFHLAAAVGVGQSMYEVESYVDVNNRGTAVLLESLIKHPVERLVVASSMSLYGEGLYQNDAGEAVAACERTISQLKARDWEPRAADGSPLAPCPTPETKPPCLASVYALSKFDQERLCLMLGAAYGIPTVALRFFNIYGTRQALSNPYTGVLAIFAARYLNGKPPLVFEDGRQQRDFVSVHDVCQACLLALEKDTAVGRAFNVGSGRPLTVLEVASELARVLGREGIVAEVTGNYRVGDIRHCFADIQMAREVLGYRPSVALTDGLVELAGWLHGQVAVDRVDEAHEELERRGLAV
jgi:dTDP-L-rhamnose 4-epimerase